MKEYRKALNGNAVNQDSSYLFEKQNHTAMVVLCVFDSLRRTCL